uniref:Carbamoyl phosphate synthase small chain n=1 Tax=Gastroclonium compressum TaxID=1852973 RepID=A0A173FZT6_GASCM|nr:carbamoyl-phosphate synthase small chain [Coeloseira compressa]ANH09539.1 carbamoyl-phosphate synthase small chain [Coeloseira compressa]
MKNMLYPAILYLKDQKYFKGWSFIKFNQSIGEVVFNTGMVGYQEIITDPSYTDQIITFAYPEIGNTGINQEDNESKEIYIKGLICKNISNYSSNWQSISTLKQYLISNNIPHIFGVDTRALTKHLRKYGSMNGCITSNIISVKNLQKAIDDSKPMRGKNLIEQVVSNQIYKLKKNRLKYKYNIYSYKKLNTLKKPSHQSSLNIIVIDFGTKSNILNILSKNNCRITIIPAFTKFSKITSYKPDGILLSNGPGDPATVYYGIHTINQIIKFTNIPIFGICMGHQILNLALGQSTFKLKFGHRGLNHPSGYAQRVNITSQNHGFAVNNKFSINQYQIHLNLNDSTISSTRYCNKPVFSVQYHPEANPGPNDCQYLFNCFLKLAQLTKNL